MVLQFLGSVVLQFYCSLVPWFPWSVIPQFSSSPGSLFDGSVVLALVLRTGLDKETTFVV